MTKLQYRLFIVLLFIYNFSVYANESTNDTYTIKSTDSEVISAEKNQDAFTERINWKMKRIEELENENQQLYQMREDLKSLEEQIDRTIEIFKD